MELIVSRMRGDWKDFEAQTCADQMKMNIISISMLQKTNE